MVNLSCADIPFNCAAHDRLKILPVSPVVGSIGAEMGNYRNSGVGIIGVTLGRRQCPVAAR